MLSDFIRGFSNALSDNVCDELIAWFESSPNVKTREPNRISRKDKQLWLPQDLPLWNTLQNCKMEMLNQYLSEFPHAYRGEKTLTSEESKIQRTNPLGGGFHNFHAEVSHYENSNRALVWTVYLNDIPSGEGETEFLFEKIRVQPKKGMGCIFLLHGCISIVVIQFIRSLSILQQAGIGIQRKELNHEFIKIPCIQY